MPEQETERLSVRCVAILDVYELNYEINETPL